MTPESHAPSVRARFSAAAGTYDEHSSIQRGAGIELLALLQGIAPRRILEVGCGTGIFTCLLAGRFPAAGIHAFDVSEPMVEEARRRFREQGRIRLQAADALTFSSPERYDLIASNASLHWVRPLPEGLANLAGHLDRGGVFAFSIMVEGTLKEIHEIRLQVAPGKPPLARLPSLKKVLEALEFAGLEARRAEEKAFEARAPSAAEILGALRRQGLTGGAYSRASAPLNRREIGDLCKEYDARHGGPGGVVASYRIGFVIAWRK